jgi:hypothetical protein
MELSKGLHLEQKELASVTLGQKQVMTLFQKKYNLIN